jgi:dipeptidyl aminopeptidase/acylaminoacyl peptidase
LGIAALLSACLLAPAPLQAQAPGRPITIDDVLQLTRFDDVRISPDGQWAAVVVQRPAGPGEVYGRTAYEVDPGRADIWLMSMRTGEKRNLTQGAATAAGFWCPAWSPDGTKLALLSTRPENGEPRGGDNVRLYVWDSASDALRRMGDAAMMTQTRYGSPLYQLDLRGGVDGGRTTHRCSSEENAPFFWVNDRSILAAMLPAGGVSGLIDESQRPAREAARTLEFVRAGEQPTVSVVGSGTERPPLEARRAGSAEIGLVDVSSLSARRLASVPVYPFRGELTLALSQDGRRLAILAPVGSIPPGAAERPPGLEEAWLAERQLGFLDLGSPGAVRWTRMPRESRYPLELFGWSPDGRQVAFRGRASLLARETPLLVASANDLSVTRLGPAGAFIDDPSAGALFPRPAHAFWMRDGRLIARLHVPPAAGAAASARRDWWLLRPGRPAVNATRAMAEPPQELRQAAAGWFVAAANDALVKIDWARGEDRPRISPLAGTAEAPAGSIAWPLDPRAAAESLVLAGAARDGRRAYRLMPLAAPGAATSFSLPQDGGIAAVDAARGTVLYSVRGLDGTHLRQVSAGAGGERALHSINTHLAAVRWGRRMLIDYAGAGGAASKGAVILPPDYREGTRYPVITWVYPGYQPQSLSTYFLDPQLPGIFNLQLYAARGFVVLIPSIPYGEARPEAGLPDLTASVLPAADRLVEMGIADPQRLGVMGHSFGGFGTYALVTQTDRFKAAVAMSGDTDFTSFYSRFSPLAHGYPGVEHEMSLNWLLAEIGQANLGVPAHEDHDRYWRHSPLAQVQRVNTPLLMVHGEYDKRADMSQAEAFFFALYRQGKPARLLRYRGESHSLAQSPANVRNIYEEVVAWFDRHLAPRPQERSETEAAGAPAEEARRP